MMVELGRVGVPAGEPATDDPARDVRRELLDSVDANRDRPRLLLTLSRRLRQQLAASPDDAELSEAFADLTLRLNALDARHAAWFRDIPNHLLMKVNGTPDRRPFLQVGESVSALLKEELHALRDARTILDFGVGLSRVMWPMMQEYPDAAFVGFDVDPMMVLHSERLESVSEARIVHSTQPIADGTVDAAYVISVFTHLMSTVDFWLGEIHRVLSEGGQALITYHDETLYADLRANGRLPRTAPAECTERLLVGTGAEGSTNLAVFYTTPYWEERLERFFVIEKTVPRGLHHNQSYSVVRRRDVAVDHDRLRHEYLCELEEELYRLRLAKKLLF
jgi:SAM-dependent methyltransferase